MTPLMQVADDGYALFRALSALADQHPAIADTLRQHAREAELIGVHAWRAAILVGKEKP